MFDPWHTERRFELHRDDDGVHHGLITGLGVGTRYGFRAHGTFDPRRGKWVNPAKLLVDPSARRVEGTVVIDGPVFPGDPDDPMRPDRRDSAALVPRCVVVADDLAPPSPRPRIEPGERLIYEAHLRGLTMTHPEVPPEQRGTYAGLAHPAVIDHLQRLGVTTVELLPIAAFADEPHLVQRGLTNFWGYNSYAWAAPHPRYAATDDPIAEVRSMVASLHAAGIEVVLDVVFNHTAEGDHTGPMLSLRGLDNHAYHLHPDDPSRYVDHTGTGNALDLSHPGVVDLVIDALVWWAAGIGVDGFRFDLTATLLRAGVHGPSPFLAAVATHPVLRDRLLIAEPWDVGPGGYHVGELPEPWLEWNDRFRDGVRDLWRGAEGSLGSFAERMAGSGGLFAHRPASTSINFVTAHDGFTLADLVSYEHKHNEANGEANRDGTNDNRSWNCGAEGPSDDAAVLALRARQQRNLIASLLLAVGTPMLLAGDEFGRTQHGNNNAYCQDNEIGWVDWSSPDADLLGFTRRVMRLRRRFTALQFQQHPEDHALTWWTPGGEPMQPSHWSTPWARALTAWWHPDLVLWWNASDAEVDFSLPPQLEGTFGVVLDTSTADGVSTQVVTSASPVRLVPHSTLVLERL